MTASAPQSSSLATGRGELTLALLCAVAKSPAGTIELSIPGLPVRL
jgi:hypothetical protein